MSTGHPMNFGYVECRWCRHQRPMALMARGDDGGMQCLDGAWCAEAMARDELRPTAGWDANGTPLGVDANGDAT